MLAIVDVNGKQYQVEEGRYVTVDRLAKDVDEVFELGNVLMVVDGDQNLVGAPFVDGAKISAKVLRHFRGPKVLVYKMRCKKGYRRKNGHRQDYTQLMIDVVDFPGKVDRPKQATEAKPARPAKKDEQPAGETAVKEKPAKKAAAPKAAAKTAEKPAAEPKAKTAKKVQPKAEDAAPEAGATPVEVQSEEAVAPVEVASETKTEE